MERTVLTLGPEGQLTLPIDIRQAMGISAGAQVEALMDGSSLTISPRWPETSNHNAIQELDQLIDELQAIFRGQPSLEEDLYAMRHEDDRRMEQKLG